uniref:VWFA domain-containing protein n=1 Tax=Esox lucius TaxID=8010 RepID=A0A6Q2X637_ESOLU
MLLKHPHRVELCLLHKVCIIANVDFLFIHVICNNFVCKNVFVCLVCQLTLTFNIDPVAWKNISTPAAGFGYKVVQINSVKLLISAPLEQYKQSLRGNVYHCELTRDRDPFCKPLPIQVPSFGVNMSLGLTMTKDPKSSNILVCGPTIPRDCNTITTYNGMCLEIKNNLQVGSRVPLSLEECPGQTDIAFLLDGSGSVYSEDFNRMKTFVKNLITQFLQRNTQFAITQFSTDFKIHMSFNDFKSNIQSWENKLQGIFQQNGMTFTAKAINRIVDSVFIPGQGCRQKAKKVLIVITDGESTDPHLLPKAVQAAERANIIRFAIGVGSAFSSYDGKKELESIASSPKINHMFQVYNFQALQQISRSLQNSIFPIEGSQATGESIEMEMAQEGFSAAYTPWVLGGFHVASVGAFQWRGAYQEYTSATKTPILKQSPNMEPDSYMGYSMAVARTRIRQFTILGAPRYKHTGRVEVFSPGVNYKPVDFSGQSGAYFGSEICAVDIDNDSYMDFVLISAPTFTDRQREGRVYVCTIMVCGFTAEMTLQGDVGKIGRFGTSLAQLPDLNVDGFNDLAVGAPLENNGKGSVYIFHGMAIILISGFDVQSGLKFFGLSISQSSLDMSSDSLPDLAVGSKGAVLLLRSKPIVTISTLVSFHPPKISTDASRSNIALKHTATVCFTMTKKTADNTKAKINYTLTLDVTRQAPNYRAYYNSQDKMRKKTETVTLSQGQQCFDHIFYIMEDPEDALNELSNELDYTFEGLPSSEGLSLSLSPQTPTTTYHPLSFEISCGTDNNCVDNLKVDFNFTGSSEMKVGIDDVLNVTVSVESREENSYNSRVILTYPAGLSFRKFITIQGKVECNSIDSEHGVTWGKSDCTINKPIFKSNSKVCPYFFFTFLIKTNHAILSQVVNYVRDFNLTVKIMVPMKLGDKYIWADPDVLNHVDFKTITSFLFVLQDCSVAMCRVFVCSVVMRKDARNSYSIAGNISSGWIEQIGLESARFSLVSSATLYYDRNQYIYFSSDSKNNPPVQTIETEVEVYPEIDFTKEIIGGAVGGLLLLALITAGLYKVYRLTILEKNNMYEILLLLL